MGTPGRILHLAKDKSLNLDNLKMFILDECDKVLENVGKSMVLAQNCTETGQSRKRRTRARLETFE